MDQAVQKYSGHLTRIGPAARSEFKAGLDDSWAVAATQHSFSNRVFQQVPIDRSGSTPIRFLDVWKHVSQLKNKEGESSSAAFKE